MYKLGLDFGTTNCTLAYFDTYRKVLECYRMRSADGSPYIPSFVRYNKDDNTIEIGRPAKKCQKDDDYRVYAAFKMLLSENSKERLKSFGYTDKYPYDCAKTYITQLLNYYTSEKNLKQAIEDIVITVPEIWIKEHNHVSHDKLLQICKELKLPLKKFVSEPVAATAYFVHNNYHQTQKWFTGHVLVCDYGGGTLDLSLCHVKRENITVLECTGKGHDQETLGKAGVAFDEYIILNVYENTYGKQLSRTNPLFTELVNRFEEQKIDEKKGVDHALEEYLYKDDDKKVFKINGMTFYASDFDNAFERVNHPVMKKSLKEMEAYFKIHSIDYKNPHNKIFKIVLAGGFSSFYLVRQALKVFFEYNPEVDLRFSSNFNLEDTALAISKGAALIANNLITIEVTCPVSVGLRLNTYNSEFVEEVDYPILKKGTKISAYEKPVFIEKDIRIEIDPTMRETQVVVFIGDYDNRKYIKLTQHIDQLFPNAHVQNNKWRVGFSVTENFCFTLHAVDEMGAKKETPIHDVLKKVTGLFLDNEINKKK